MTEPLLTVVVPTKDEALHVERCVRSVEGLGAVVVVDSFSTDGTQQVARSVGARVVEREWRGYSEQKNWALDRAGIETEWVLFLDADEYLTTEGRAEIADAVRSGRADGFELPRAYVFLGAPLRRAWWYPDLQLRLFRRVLGRFEERRVHEHVVLEGRVEQLRHALMHENLKGLSAFIERHNRYSDLEAAEIVAPSTSRRRGSFVGSATERRRALKDRLWYRLPLRPLVRFLWLYFVKRGFIDGRRGFVFCSLIAAYDVMTDAKVAELELAGMRREAETVEA